jgi:ABC-2 type transport system ATP-binding protein
MIVANAVSYEYPNLRALSDVSFTIGQGAIAALIGPNGAGKTTLMRCLAALEPPYSGTIEIDGIDTAEHPREVHKRIGYLSDFFGVYRDLTVERCLRHAAMAGGVPPENVGAAVARAAARVELSDRMTALSGTLSRGLRQRLGIAQAMIHDPTVLILDEPASGLDPRARVELRNLLGELRSMGKTIVVSSHILSELAEMCTEIGIMEKGALLASGTPASIRGQIGSHRQIRVRLVGGDERIVEVADDEEQTALLRKLLDDGESVLEFTEVGHGLEDIFMQITTGEVQ